MSRHSVLKRIIGKRIANFLVFVLIASFAFSLVPQNVLSFSLDGAIDSPLFAIIPTVPLDAVGNGAAGEPVSQNLASASPEITPISESTSIGSPAFIDLSGDSIDDSLISLEDMFFDAGRADWDKYGSSAPDYSRPLMAVELSADGSESDLNELAAKYGATVIGKVPGTNVYKIQSGSADAADLLQSLSGSDAVKSVQRDRRFGPDRVQVATQGAAEALRSKLVEVTPAKDSDWEALDPSLANDAGGQQPVEQAAVEQISAVINEPTDITSASISQTPMVASASDSQYGSSADSNVAVSAPSLSIYDPSLYDSSSAETATESTGSIQEAPHSVTKPTVTPSTRPAQPTLATEPQPTATRIDEAQEIVPVKAVGSEAKPTEYAAPSGEIGVRFAESVSIGGKLVDVSKGDKGFTINADDSLNGIITSSPARVSDSGVSYSDPAGAQVLFTPKSTGLSIRIAYAAGSEDAFNLNLPLFGLFARQNIDGSITLLDLDNGKSVFTLSGGDSSVGGKPMGSTVVSLIDSSSDFLRLVVSAQAADRDLANATSGLPTRPAVKVVGRVEIKYMNDDGLELTGSAGQNLAIVGDKSDSVPVGYLASLGLGEGQIFYGAPAGTLAKAVKRASFSEFTASSNSATLRIRPIQYGTEQEIVLNEVPASNRFELPLTLNKLSLKQSISGDLEVIDELGATVATISARLMYDSRPASEGGPARSGMVNLELVENDDGSKTLLITADADWLSDPARVYPIFIDPTTSTQFPSANAIVPSTTPSFFWSYSDPTYAQVDAVVEIATDPGHADANGDIVFDHTVYSSGSLGANTRFTLPAVNALSEGIYYWRAWVKNSQGVWGCSACSAGTTGTVFYVNSTHVASIYGSLPAKLPAGAMVSVPITVKNRGTATWNATGADNYVLSYGLTWTDSAGTHGERSSIKTPLPYDLPPGQEVVLNAELKVPSGALNNTWLTFNWDMVQNGICWFSDRGERPFTLTAMAQTGWNANYAPIGQNWQGFPSAANAGETLPLPVKAKNTGATTWSYASGQNNVAMGGHWISASGNDVTSGVSYSGGGLPGPNDVSTNNTAEFNSFTLHVPTIPGAYIFKLDLWNTATNEWFSSQGVPTLDIPIMVSANGVMPGVSFAKISDAAQLNLVSGNLVISATDFVSNGRGPPINITRTFNTLSTDPDPDLDAGVFGMKWSSILDSKLSVNTDDGSVIFLASDGAALTFIPSLAISGYQTYVHPRGLFLTLEQKLSDGTFQLINQDQMLTYNFSAPVSGISQLASIVDNNGNTTTFNYVDGKVTSITEASGDSARSVQISYVAQGQNGAGNIAYIKVPSGDSARGYSFWTYGYDAINQLISAVFDPANDPDTGNPNSGSLSIPTNYVYTGSPVRLTGITTKYGAGGQDSTTTIDYDSGTGRLIKIHDPRPEFSANGTTINYSADQTGRGVTMTNAVGGCTSFFLGWGLQTISTTAAQSEAIFEETFANSDLSNWGPIATNVARGKTTSSSGNYAANYGSGNIVDGAFADSSTVDYWLPPANQDVNNPAWVQVDLGASYTVNGMRFLPTRDGNTLKWATRNWHITVSNDNIVWTDVAKGSLPGAVKVSGQLSPMLWNEVRMSPSLVRYVRFYVDSYSGYGGGLNELQVYGSPVGVAPSDIWSVSTNPVNSQEKVIKAAPFTSTQAYAEEYLVSKDSYSDFVFETSIRMENPGTQPNVGIVFRETNSKTNFVTGDGVLGDDGVNAHLGFYLFRASGIDVDANGVKQATLWKRENNGWTPLARYYFTEGNPAPGTDWYKLKVEAIGSQIKCYYQDMTTALIPAQYPLQDFVNDQSFARGRVGFMSLANQNSVPKFYFGGSIGSTPTPIRVYGKAHVTYSYDGEGNLAGQNQALSSTVNKFDDEVHGWSAQLPEQRFSIREEAGNAANNVLFGDDSDAPNTIWTGDTSWTSYSVEARVKLLYAGATGSFWPVGGNAGIVIRSNGDPENGYYVGLAPNVNYNGVYLWKMQSLGNSPIVAWSGPKPVIGQWTKVKIVISGIHIQVFINDSNSPAFQWDDSTIANGKVGLRVATARAVFDDVKIIGPDNVVWKYDDFQARGDLSSTLTTDKVSGLPSGESYLYDANNRPYAKTDQNKRTITVTRDEKGNVITEADPAGTVKLNTYDGYGNLIGQTIPVQQSFNYVPNPSFETTDDWEMRQGATTSTVSYNNTNAYQGLQALKLYHNGTDDWIGSQSSFIPVKAGEVYTISAFVKSAGFTQGTAVDGGQHHHVYLRFWSSNAANRPPQNYKGEFGAEIPTTATSYDWERIFKSVSVPSGATYADVLVALVGGGGVASNVWLDGIQVELGAVAPEFNNVQNPGASISTTDWSWTPDSFVPTDTTGTVSGSAPTNNNWASLPDGWGINDKGEMGISFWKDRGGITVSDTMLTSTNTYDSSSTTFSSKIKMDMGKDVGLAFRVQANGDMYFVRCSGYKDDKDNQNDANETVYKTALWKKQGGAWTKISSGNGARMVDASTGAALIPQPGNWYTVTVRVSGTLIEWWYQVNGVGSIGYQINDPAFSAGKVGLRVGSEYGYSNNFHHFDDVEVTAASGDFTDNFAVYNPFFQENHTSSTVTSAWTQTLSEKTVTPGQNYTFTAKVFTAAGGTGLGGARLRIIWRDASGNIILDKDECSSFYTTGGTWLNKAITGIAPDNATSARVSLEQASFQGETRFDDMSFERASGQGGFSLIGNGSFETIGSANGKAAGWSYDNLANWALDTKTFKYGKSSIMVSNPWPGDNWAAQNVRVKPSTTYTLSAWIKTSAVASRRGAGALLHVINGGECYTTNPVTGDTDWNLQALQFTTGPNVSSITVGLQQGFGGPSSGTTWFDGIQLVEKSPRESYYEYDTNGNFVISSLDSTGASSRYVLNKVGGRTQSIIDSRSSDGMLTAISTQSVFDHAGRLLSTTYPMDSSGLQEVVSSTYDKAGNKLTQTVLLPGSEFATTAYTYNAAGLKATEEDPHAQLFADDFSSGANFPNGTNYWTSQHTTQWTIQSDNSFRGTANGNLMMEMSLAGNATWGNYTYQASVKIESGRAAGLLFQSGGQFPSDYCLFELQPSGGQWVLKASDAGGTITQIASGAYSISLNTLYQLKLVVNGSAASIFINNANVWNGSLGASHTRGKIGLLVGADNSGSGAARFYNVNVTEAGLTTYSYDLAGRLLTETRALGDNATRISFTYDGLGRNLGKTYEDTLSSPATYSIKTSSTYNEEGNKLTETDALGNVTRYVYNSSGACASFDRLGKLTSTIRSISQDNLSESGSIDARGNMEVDKASAAGIVSTTDQRNNTVNNTYTGAGSLASRVDAGLAPWLFSYDALGRPGFFRDPFGNEIKFAYDDLGRLALRTDARGLKQLFSYDNLGRPISRGDSSRSDVTAAPAKFGWDVAGRASYFINSGDTAHFVDYSYDTAGNLIKAVYYDGKSAAFGYSSFGALSSVRDLTQNVTSYSYDQIGRLQNLGSSYYAGGAVLTLAYNANGNVISRSNPDGTSESYTYDKENRMISFSLTKNGSQLSGATYTYDAAGNRTTVTDSLTTNTTSYAYDPANQLTQVTNPDGGYIGYTYDANGNRLSTLSDVWLDNFTGTSIDPSWSQLYGTWIIDSQNGLKGVSSAWSDAGIAKSASLSNASGYTFQSKIKMSSDSKNVGLAFDIQNNGATLYMIRATGLADDKDSPGDPYAKTALWKKTAGGWVKLSSGAGARMIDANGAALMPQTGSWYTVKLSVSGSTISWWYEVNGVWSIGYTITDSTYSSGGVGLLVGAGSNTHFFTNTQLLMKSASYTYDAANQLTRITNGSGQATGFSYDASGNNISEGTIYRSFDERNRLTGTSISATTGITYSYDAQGNLLCRGACSALLADDFASGIGAWNSSAGWSNPQDSGNYVAKGTYTSESTVATSWRNVIASDYTYNARLKITSTSVDTATSGLILRSDAGPGGFGIDHNEYYFGIYPGQSQWKLWKVTAGNFGASPVASGTQSFNLNQYYSLSVNAVSNVLMLYIDGSLKYTYTDTSSSPNPYNSYNAIGLRTRNAVTYFDDVRIDSQATAPTSYYRYNSATGALMHELDAAGNIKVSYTTDPKGNPVSVTRYNGGTATTFFFHYNAHGDVVAITDSNGNVVAKFGYDSWGVPTELSSTGVEQAIGTWTIPTGGTPGQGMFFLFGGMLYDAAAGLYLTKTRAYNPKIGRFLQRDILDESAKDGYDGFPFGKDAIGTNLYAWCGNNPVTRVDPSGKYYLDIYYSYEVTITESRWVPYTGIYWLDGCIPIFYETGYWYTETWTETVWAYDFSVWVDDPYFDQTAPGARMTLDTGLGTGQRSVAPSSPAWMLNGPSSSAYADSRTDDSFSGFGPFCYEAPAKIRSVPDLRAAYVPQRDVSKSEVARRSGGAALDVMYWSWRAIGASQGQDASDENWRSAGKAKECEWARQNAATVSGISVDEFCRQLKEQLRSEPQ